MEDRDLLKRRKIQSIQLATIKAVITEAFENKDISILWEHRNVAENSALYEDNEGNYPNCLMLLVSKNVPQKIKNLFFIPYWAELDDIFIFKDFAQKAEIIDNRADFDDLILSLPIKKFWKADKIRFTIWKKLFPNNEIEDCPYFTGIISNNVFENHSSLKSITIPDSVTKIGDNVFKNCKKLETINFSDSIDAIGKNAFENCISLFRVELPQKLQRINEETFFQCLSLRYVTIGKNVEAIESKAFESCRSLFSVKIPKSVKRIEVDAFEDCINLQKIYYEGTSEDWNNIEIDSNSYLLTSEILFESYLIFNTSKV